MSKILVLCVMLLVGAALIVASHGRERRPYLLFLGLAFWALGSLLLTPKMYQLIPLAVAVLAFMLAIVHSIRATRERIRQFKELEQRREAAFGDYLTAVAHEQTEETPPPPSDAQSK